jgi:ABC-type lipoprotein export system ATPase subunit
MVSGGQQQRAAIARALATDPPLLIADEPTGNLDAKTAGQVFDLFMQLIEEQGKTMLMVTHDQELAARIPRKIEIVNGLIAQDSRPQIAVPVPAKSNNGVVVGTPANGISHGIFNRLVPNSLTA